MSRDERGGWRVVAAPDATDEPREVPLDVELERLDAELRAAGARARLAVRGSTQPTRFFSQELRQRLLSRAATPR
jgi:hypothetical protein